MHNDMNIIINIRKLKYIGWSYSPILHQIFSKERPCIFIFVMSEVTFILCS